MTYVPGQKDPLFEAVQGIITGGTEEGRYAQRALGYTPTVQESVRVEDVPLESRDYLRERLTRRIGQDGPPGWKYGQRVYYGDQAFRILEFNQGDGFYETLRLTLVSDDFTQRLRGVEANEVTYPTHTTAIGEEAEPVEEGDAKLAAAKLMGRTSVMEQPLETVIALWSIEAVKLLDRRVQGNGHKAMATAQKDKVQRAIRQAAKAALSR